MAVTSPNISGNAATATSAAACTGNAATASDVQAGSSLERKALRAFVNFNGSGVVSIRGSYNVSSITDNGVGTFVVNFSVVMPDANYVFSGNADSPGAANGAAGSDAAVFGTAGFALSTVNPGATARGDYTVITAMFAK